MTLTNHLSSTKIYTLLMLFVGFFPFHARSSDLSDTLEIKRLLDRGGMIAIEKIDSAQHYADRAFELSKLSSDEKWIARCYRLFGLINYLKGDYSESIDKYQKALDYFSRTKHQEENYKILSGIGMAYSRLGHYQKATEFLVASLKQAEAQNDHNVMAVTYNSLGVMAKEQKDYQEAIRCYRNTIALYKKAGTRNSHYAGAYTNLANVYMLEEEIDSAILLNRYALQLFDSLNSDRGRVICYSNLGECYLKKQSIDLALEYREKAYNLSLGRPGFHFSEINALLGLGELHVVLRNYTKAESYLLKAIKEIDNKEKAKLIKAHMALADCYKGLGNDTRANESLVKVIGLKDSLFSQEMSEAVANAKAMYEFDKQEKQIELLEKDKEIQQIILWAGLLGFILIAFAITILFLKHREKVRKDRLISEEREQVSRLKEEQFTQQLEFKNKTITTHTLNIIQKNEMLADIREQVLQMANTTKDAQTKILKIAKLIDQSSSIEKDWEEFKLYFEQVHNKFFDQLKSAFPELTPNDLKLCALIRLNLNIKQTSNLMNISTESVKMARYRLRKKLDLLTEDNLTEYLGQF